MVHGWLDEVRNKVHLTAVDAPYVTDFTFNYATPAITNEREGYKQTGIMLSSGVSDLKVILEE